MTAKDRGYYKSESWLKVRVWWEAKHRFRGTTHLAVTLGGGKLTRCGMRFYYTAKKRRGKNFALYEWTRLGHDPIVPTCPQCLRLIKWDQGGQVGNPVG